MIKNDYIVRSVRKDEYETTENLVRESFWNVYRPGCLEHYVLHCMRQSRDYMPRLDMILEHNGTIIGQNIFAKAGITADDGSTVPVFTMGPVCISPEYQGTGLGRLLLEKSIEAAEKAGVNAIFIEGDIGFYGKCGFDYGKKHGIRYHGLPQETDTSFFLCRIIAPGCLDGISGEYCTPPVYFVSEEDREKFDKKFPPKDKKVLPGQIF